MTQGGIGFGKEPTTPKPTPPSRPRPGIEPKEVNQDFRGPGPMREWILRIMLGQIQTMIRRDPEEAIEFIQAILDGRVVR